MKKFFGKAALLTAIICIILFALSPFFTPKWIEGNIDNGWTYVTTTTSGYLNSDEKLDVLFVGSSQVLRGVLPTQLMDEYGISAWDRATPVMAPTVAYYFLEDALERREVDLVVADFSSALYSEYDPDDREPYIRYSYDYMPLSGRKLRAVRNSIKTSSKQTLIDYVFPSVYYHDRTLSKIDLTWPFTGDKTDPMRGAIPIDEFTPQDYTPLLGEDVTPEEYVESSLIWYQKMMDLCKEKGVDFIMLRSPRADWTEGKHAADKLLAKKNGVPLWDINLKEISDKLELDPEKDFYDFNHLSLSGAKKMTHWLGEQLQPIVEENRKK